MLNNDSTKEMRAIFCAAVLGSVALGCSAEAAPTTSNSGGAGSATGTSGTSSSTPGSAGTAAPSNGGSSTSSGGMASPGPSKPLPIVIDDFFAPSGYMEDAREGNAGMTPAFEGDDTTCGGDRAPEGRGFCHIVTFTFPEGGLGWGGVFWQYPAANWGTMPGLNVEPGATKVRFQARGETGTEKIGFFAGIGTGSEAYADKFKIANQDFTLTTEWKEYSLPLAPAADYSNGVVGPIAWGAGSEANELPVKFYLDDITFE